MHHKEQHDLAPAPLKFDRRRDDRAETGGVATGFRLTGDQFGHIHDLMMMDFSAGGMCATSEHPIEPGVMLSVGFGAPGHLARRGVVTRCIPCGEGYRIGVQFQMGLAA